MELHVYVIIVVKKLRRLMDIWSKIWNGLENDKVEKASSWEGVLRMFKKNVSKFSNEIDRSWNRY